MDLLGEHPRQVCCLSEAALNQDCADVRRRFEAAGIKGTWFLNGQNKGNIYDYNSTLFRMISLGHQIGSHTYVLLT